MSTTLPVHDRPNRRPEKVARPSSQRAGDASPVPAISPTIYRAFHWYSRRFVRRNFHSMRVARAGAPAPQIDPTAPLIVYMNHPSWWDPLVGLLLAQHYWPSRSHYAPIDAAMLRKYRFFAKLGFFGIEQSSVHGGTAFLRTAMAIASTPGSCMWITAQGNFTDPRVRPVALAPGLSRLLRHIDGHATILPLAIEYPFWTEREPEAMVRFGQPLSPSDIDQHVLESSLQRAMDDLAGDVQSRDAGRFDVLLSGTTGTSLPYDAWRWLRSKFERTTFSTAHLEQLQQK